MIGSLSGKLLFKGPTESIVDVNGIGFRVTTSLNTFYQLPNPGEAVFLHVYTHVREDALLLYGFISPKEREFFKKLIGVSGIGPKQATNILSGITPEELYQAVKTGNADRLCTIPGVGKKTSQRLVLELKDKLDLVGPKVLLEQSQKEPPDLLQDIGGALINLGYNAKEVEKVLKNLQNSPIKDFNELLKEAFKVISK